MKSITSTNNLSDHYMSKHEAVNQHREDQKYGGPLNTMPNDHMLYRKQ